MTYQPDDQQPFIDRFFDLSFRPPHSNPLVPPSDVLEGTQETFPFSFLSARNTPVFFTQLEIALIPGGEGMIPGLAGISSKVFPSVWCQDPHALPSEKPSHGLGWSFFFFSPLQAKGVRLIGGCPRPLPAQSLRSPLFVICGPWQFFRPWAFREFIFLPAPPLRFFSLDLYPAVVFFV